MKTVRVFNSRRAATACFMAGCSAGAKRKPTIEPMLKRRMLERNLWAYMVWLPSVSDKPTRARSFQAMAATGRVKFEPGADVGEFLMFPAGKHDDDVDCASLIGRAIDQAHPAILKIPPPPPNAPSDGYRPDHLREESDWKIV